MEYDKHLDFYYSNLINSIILFTYNAEALNKLQDENIMTIMMWFMIMKETLLEKEIKGK